MTTITIDQAGKVRRTEVTLKGWLYNLRESGKLLFPIFRDGTGIIQGVCALKENPEAFESLKGLTQESSVIVTGKIRAEKARSRVATKSVSARSRSSRKFRRARPSPSSSRSMGSISCSTSGTCGFERRASSNSAHSRRSYPLRPRIHDGQGYTLTDAPMFTPAACEGTSTLFEVNYIDDQKAYLTQSGQLYAEAIAMALGKVYTFGPPFAPKNRRPPTSH